MKKTVDEMTVVEKTVDEITECQKNNFLWPRKLKKWTAGWISEMRCSLTLTDQERKDNKKSFKKKKFF